MPGGSVYDFLHKQKGVFKLPSLIRVAIDVSKGMDYLHKNNIIRRDLKAANLLMDENEVKGIQSCILIYVVFCLPIKKIYIFVLAYYFCAECILEIHNIYLQCRYPHNLCLDKDLWWFNISKGFDHLILG